MLFMEGHFMSKFVENFLNYAPLATVICFVAVCAYHLFINDSIFFGLIVR